MMYTNFKYSCDEKNTNACQVSFRECRTDCDFDT